MGSFVPRGFFGLVGLPWLGVSSGREMSLRMYQTYVHGLQLAR